jgi:hypothetical protein
MLQLHLNCQKDHLYYQRCLQRTSLGEELKYSMFTESGESMVIKSKVMMTAHVKAFRTLKIGLTGMGI